MPHTKRSQKRQPLRRKPFATRRAIKFLASCRDPIIHSTVIRRSPDTVLKQLCNAALNAERGDVHFSPGQKELLRKYRKPISALTSKHLALPTKRRIILQKGGGIAAIVLPLILSGVLSSLGSSLFSGK